MAGHSHSANIAHRKAAVDSKRSKLWSKLARGIIVGFGVRGYSMAINGLYEMSQRAG